MKLSAADKRLVKAITSFPWDESQYVSLYDSLSEQMQRVTDRLAVTGQTVDDIAPDHLRAWSPIVFQSVFTWELHGIARRIIYDDPAELVRFTLVGIRGQWLCEGFSRNTNAPDLHIDGFWATLLAALALGDTLVESRMTSSLPFPLPKRTGNNMYPNYYSDIYNVIFGYVKEDTNSVSTGLNNLAVKSLDPENAAIVGALRAIHEQSPSEFASSVAEHAKAVRRLRAVDPHYKLISLTLHGLVALANRVNPEIAVEWNADGPFPWDAGLHKWMQQTSDPTSSIELDRVPALIRDLIVGMPEVLA